MKLGASVFHSRGGGVGGGRSSLIFLLLGYITKAPLAFFGFNLWSNVHPEVKGRWPSYLMALNEVLHILIAVISPTLRENIY